MTTKPSTHPPIHPTNPVRGFVALDIGNVCMAIHPWKCLEMLGLDRNAHIPKEILSACSELEKGKLDDRTFLDVFHSWTGRRFTDAQLVEAWNSILGDEFDGMYPALERITGLGYRIIFFSDTSLLHLARIFRVLRLSVLVSGGIYSFEVGASKPDGAIYEAFEKKYGIPVFYTDDKLPNIEAGLSRGWFSRQFTSPDDFLKAFMQRHGQLISKE